jgi:hypothetical protein
MNGGNNDAGPGFNGSKDVGQQWPGPLGGYLAQIRARRKHAPAAADHQACGALGARDVQRLHNLRAQFVAQRIDWRIVESEQMHNAMSLVLQVRGGICHCRVSWGIFAALDARVGVQRYRSSGRLGTPSEGAMISCRCYRIHGLALLGCGGCVFS